MIQGDQVLMMVRAGQESDSWKVPGANKGSLLRQALFSGALTVSS